MITGEALPEWQPGVAPVAVVMISLNEGHNMEAVIENLKGWAQEVFLVDSYSSDRTVDICLENGVHVVQRRFRNFGDQWNFAISALGISAEWTMKLDPDERMTDSLKSSILDYINRGECSGLSFDRRLWFMGKQLPITQSVTRVWRTGHCRFTDVLVNEHPIIDGVVLHVPGQLEHHDSPNLEHWIDKQNKYSTLEAEIKASSQDLAASPRIFGSDLERRMWIKKHFYLCPFGYLLLFLYYYIYRSMWRAGWVGYAWSKLRSIVHFMIYAKYREMLILGEAKYAPYARGVGTPDDRVQNYE